MPYRYAAFFMQREIIKRFFKQKEKALRRCQNQRAIERDKTAYTRLQEVCLWNTL